MDEMIRMVRVNREYAEGLRLNVVADGQVWDVDHSVTHAYYEGQVDALDRLLEAWKFLGYKVDGEVE